MTNSRNKLFDNFLSGGFGDLNKHDPQDAHHFSFYKKNILSFLPDNKKAPILEIGFGLGQFMSFLAQKKYSNVVGVEVSKEMYDYNLKVRKLKNIFLVDDVLIYLLDKRNKFEAVILNDVIEHLDKSQVLPILEAIRRSLVPNGVVIIKTNNVAAITGARMRYEDFTHETSFTPYSLRQVLRVSGYDEVCIRPYRVPLTNPLRALRILLQGVVHLVWMFVYWLEYTTIPPVVHEFMIGIGTKKK